MKVSSGVQNKILFLSDKINMSFLNLNSSVLERFQLHFNQAEQIKQLSDSLREKQQIEYLLEALKVEYKDLLQSIDSPLSLNLPQISSVRMLSYIHINNYKKIWLEYKSKEAYQEGTIFGLINENKAAGIAILRNHRLEGFLNGDEKCSYSVVVGNRKLQGVAKYDINKGFIVDYIPLYPKVEIGEIVRTSGNDSIFYPGIFVGVVEEVELRQGYQIAIIKSALLTASRFYWLVDIKNPDMITSLENNNTTKSQENLEENPLDF